MPTPDYILELSGTAQIPESAWKQKRPWIAMLWRCCHAYSRIYRNHRKDAYAGCCPRCGTPVRLEIGPGGTASRFFIAET